MLNGCAKSDFGASLSFEWLTARAPC
jgi:hypothetical protein